MSVQCSVFRGQCSVLRVQGPGFRVQDSGFRVQGETFLCAKSSENWKHGICRNGPAIPRIRYLVRVEGS